MLDPQLRAGLLEEGFDGNARRCGLIHVELGSGEAVQLALLRIMIQIAADQYGTGLGEPEKQDPDGRENGRVRT